MTVATKRAIAWAVFVASVLGLMQAFWFEWHMLHIGAKAGWSNNGLVDGLLFTAMILSFSVTGLLIATRRPENRLGWILLAIGAAWGLSPGSYGSYSLIVHPLPFGRWALAFDQWTWVPAVGLIGTYTILLFPDGHLPSPRWRWFGWLTALTFVVCSIAILFSTSPIAVTSTLSIANPFGIRALEAILDPLQLVVIVIPICIVVSAVSLVMRFRRSRGVERQQIKWLAYAGGIVATLYLIVMILSMRYAITGEPQPGWLNAAQIYTIGTFILIPIAIGFAVLRYRLYDIDVVISKTVVFGALVAFITIVYVAVAVGLGSLLGDASNPALSLAATALVALLFGPVRERVRRFANRLVYGKRATPYQVMAGFAHRVSGSVSVEQVLPEMAEVAGRGVGARAARIRVELPRGVERSRVWPDAAEGPFERSLPVRYQGEEVGAIDVAKPPGEALSPAEERLLTDLAAQAGLALHNVRLTEELAIRAEELAAQAEGLRISRERLVTARDAQRRGLERDIREGPSQQLLDIRRRIGQVNPDVPSAAAAELDDLAGRANDTLEGLRDLARGIFPPLLADKGIVPALEAHIRKVGAHAIVEPEASFGDLRFDADTEACVYFCCLQAIQNVIRHAGNAPSVVRLGYDHDAALAVAIEDGGRGFDLAEVTRGMGMQIMQDRVDALDGRLEITSAPGAGTRVAIDLPARALQPLAGEAGRPSP